MTWVTMAKHLEPEAREKAKSTWSVPRLNFRTQLLSLTVESRNILIEEQYRRLERPSNAVEMLYNHVM